MFYPWYNCTFPAPIGTLKTGSNRRIIELRTNLDWTFCATKPARFNCRIFPNWIDSEINAFIANRWLKFFLKWNWFFIPVLASTAMKWRAEFSIRWNWFRFRRSCEIFRFKLSFEKIADFPWSYSLKLFKLFPPRVMAKLYLN